MSYINTSLLIENSLNAANISYYFLADNSRNIYRYSQTHLPILWEFTKNIFDKYYDPKYLYNHNIQLLIISLFMFLMFYKFIKIVNKILLNQELILSEKQKINDSVLQIGSDIKNLTDSFLVHRKLRYNNYKTNTALLNAIKKI